MIQDEVLGGLFLVLALISYYFYPNDKISLYAGIVFLVLALVYFFKWKHPTNKKLLAEKDE